MNVTGVKITKRFDGDSPLKCFASVSMDHALTIKGFKLMELQGDLQLMPPSEKDKKNRVSDDTGKPLWWDTVFFHKKNTEGKDLFERVKEAVIRAYQNKDVNNEEREPDAFAEEGFLSDDSDDIPF